VIHPEGSPVVALRGEVVRTETSDHQHYDVGVRLLTTPAQNPLVLRELDSGERRRRRVQEP
jgi:hypothetical protein